MNLTFDSRTANVADYGGFRRTVQRHLKNPHWHWALILLSMVAYLCALPFGVTHLDLARDISTSLGIINLERFPLEGPLLGGTLHLGPVWDYLAAIPLLPTHSWLAVVMAMGFLAALKFPMAYALGSRLIDPGFGLLWALMLALPGWNNLETVFVLFTSFVAICTLTFLWFLVRYFETGFARYLFGLSIFYALSLHAHPSTYGLALVAIPFVLRRWFLSGIAPVTLVIASVVFLVPFMPFIAAQVISGSSDIHAAAVFFASDDVGKIYNFLPVMHGSLVTGPQLIALNVLRLSGSWFEAYAIFYGILWSVAIVGLISALITREKRRTAIAGIATVAAISVSVVMIRAYTPYYMSFVILTVLLGLGALGIRQAIALPGVRYVAYPIVVGVVVLPIAVSVAAAKTFATGSYSFSFMPMFGITQPYSTGLPLPFIPAYAMAESGDALCGSRRIVAHGALAFHLLHDYAIETRLRCTSPPAISLGGIEPADAVHIVGLSRALSRALGVDLVKSGASVDLGPMSFLPLGRAVSPTSGSGTATPGTYPPVSTAAGQVKLINLQFETHCDEVVLVTNMYFGFAPDPTVDARLNGEPVLPAAEDALSKAYACSDRSPKLPARWTLQIATPAPDRVDVVTVASPI
jgi:hypothetical protein